MVLAARGLPSLWLVAATLIGGTLAAGSANTVNCYLDRDIDEVMLRTAARPLVRHQVSPAAALRFGLVLGAAATVWLAMLVNWPAALLSDGAILFYVFVYTLGLKRRTPANIVIGGAAGCFPVLVGWAAVTGTVGWPAAALFAVVFFWTPPHFWALAMRFKDDYAAAGVPSLPVVASPPLVAHVEVAVELLQGGADLVAMRAGGPSLLAERPLPREGRRPRPRGVLRGHRAATGPALRRRRPRRPSRRRGDGGLGGRRDAHP